MLGGLSHATTGIHRCSSIDSGAIDATQPATVTAILYVPFFSYDTYPLHPNGYQGSHGHGHYYYYYYYYYYYHVRYATSYYGSTLLVVPFGSQYRPQ